jgi:hypothetical protein
MADGTVRAVSAPIIPRNIPSASNGVVFEGITTTHTWQGFDVKIDSTNPDRFIVAYRGSGSYGACVLGTVSGTTITFGTEVIFSSEATTNRQISFAPNSSGKFAISYRKTDPGYTAGIKIGTISGTSITFGTEVVVSSATTYFHSCAFDLVDNNKLVAMYSNSGTYIKVGTVSGTSVSFGSQVSVGINSGVGLVKSVGTSKFIILVAGTVKIGTISGSSMTVGTAVSLPWDNVEMAAMAVNPIDLTSFIVQYKGKNNSVNRRNGTMVAGTISGTSITLGSYIEFFPQNDTGARDHAIEFSPHSSGKFAYMYTEDSTNDAMVNTGSVSGTTITLDTPTEIHAESDHNAVGIAFMSGGKFVYVTKIGNASNFTASGSPLGSAHVGQMQATGASTLNSLSYVGLSSADYTDGQTASIILKGGVSENQSGLTAGSRYYIQGDGTLGTSEATPSVEAGLAINATTLLLSGPAGEDGATGATGATGAAGSTGIQGIQGIQGTAGLGIQFLGQVATIGDLPASSNTQGDAYIVQADDSLHVWDGTSAWVSGGSIQGPQGIQGVQGNVGSAGADSTVAGPVGPAGADGPESAPVRVEFAATANQATKTGLTYTVGNIDCYINGVKISGTGFTASDGVSVTFTPALALNDEVQLIMGAAVSSDSVTVIAPAAQGYINSENSGTAAGCSYTYNAGTTTVTFNTAMPDTNYSVITDKEGFDEHQVLTGSKTLTSFVMQSRDSAGTGVMSPASWPYSFVVYASDPVQSLVATKGDTGDTGLTGATGATGGASSLDSLSDTTVSTTDPLVTTNPSAIGHLWVNSTTANAYICTDITTGSNVWVNIGSGTGNVEPDSFSGGTYTAVGGYKYRTFTSSGALQQTGSGTVDMLVVAGGGSGAGANNSNGGGGGAGGYLSGSLTLTAGTYNIVIGAGGAGAVQLAGNNGGNTTVSIINAIAIGGGHAGGGARNSQVPASNGGSGGGGSGFSQDTAGGSGTQADSGGLIGFGNDGGSASSNVADGGGGAGGAGTINGSNGHGGLGRQWVDNNYYAGGGGGGGSTGYSGNGGSSVGGNGGYDDLVDLDAIVNTGSGGGGSWASATTGYAGGNGSSGIVIIRYT